MRLRRDWPARIGFTLLVALFTGAAIHVRGHGASPGPHVEPLRQAHAHNDYRHKRPLLDALDHGFCSIEADVFLEGGELLVGHSRDELRPERTLEKLYLAPLQRWIRQHGGSVYRNGPGIFLLIDIKSDAESTYAALSPLLARYGDILSVAREGRFEPKAVTVVISGNRPQETIRSQPVAYAGIDGRPADLESDAPAHLVPWISANWTELFSWKGEGPMPDDQRAKLRDYVRTAHDHGRMVRFWATPENSAVWSELLAAGVDLIGTDDLAKLRQFLLDRASRGE